MATFSLRQLLVLIAIIALACASIVRPFLHLEELLGLSVLIFVAYRTAEAVLAVGQRRYAASGAAIFAWTYIAVVRIGKIGGLEGLAEALRRLLHSGRNAQLEEDLFWLSVLLFLVVGSWLGGLLGTQIRSEPVETTDSEQSG